MGKGKKGKQGKKLQQIPPTNEDGLAVRFEALLGADCFRSIMYALRDDSCCSNTDAIMDVLKSFIKDSSNDNAAFIKAMAGVTDAGKLVQDKLAELAKQSQDLDTAAAIVKQSKEPTACANTPTTVPCDCQEIAPANQTPEKPAKKKAKPAPDLDAINAIKAALSGCSANICSMINEQFGALAEVIAKALNGNPEKPE